MATAPSDPPKGSETLQIPRDSGEKLEEGNGEHGRELQRRPLTQSEKQFTREPGSKVFTLKDIPPRPTLVLKLTQTQKSYWERFIEAVRGLSPRDFLKSLHDEKKRILAKAKKGETITEDETDFLNSAMREEIDQVFDNFKLSLQDILRIEQTDDPQMILFKVSFTQQLLKWLDALFEWMMKKIDEILAMVETKGSDWCVKKAKELFAALLAKMTEDK